MRDAHHCSGPPVSEMTYTVSSGTLNSTIPYRQTPFPYDLLPPAIHILNRRDTGDEKYCHGN